MLKLNNHVTASSSTGGGAVNNTSFIMGMNESAGNMYEFVSHTWNAIKGECYFKCRYCFMKKLFHGRDQPQIHFDESELSTDLGSGNFIFVGSSIDMWASEIPSDWILRVLDYLDRYDNRYLFQSKSPSRFLEFKDHPVFKKATFCTTLESNRDDFAISQAPSVKERADAMADMYNLGYPTYVTAEPCRDFDIDPFIKLIRQCHPIQLNIGRNSYREVELDEPSADKVQALVKALREDMTVKVKRNAWAWMK